MRTYEEKLSAALHELASQDKIPPAPVGRLLHRGHLAKRIRVIGLATAAFGAGAVAAVVVGVGVPAVPPPADRTDGLATATATQTTAQSSFRFTLVASLTSNDPGAPGGQNEYDGAFDPLRHTGYLRSRQGSLELRVVNGQAYVMDGLFWHALEPGEPWLELPGSYISGSKLPGGLVADPEQQLKALRSLGEVTHEGGGLGGVQRYMFWYAAKGDGVQMPVSIPVTGIVEVRAGKVSSIEYELVIDFKGVYEIRTWRWTFSDYGAPVEVDRPKTR
ncbi:MAG TPA: hypothetical protein VFM55_10230 [Micromonosporaceae bacterium]|nr:hypothetical protein [Micromonosporaceae bacterium]